jgi:hypothetical protein
MSEAYLNEFERRIMRKSIIYITALAVFLSLFAGVSFAQTGKGDRGWGPGSGYNRMYNPEKVETLRGEIEKIDYFTERISMNRGVHIVLKTDKESISVHLGPPWYVHKLGIKLAPGDKVQVTGSRIIFNKKPAIMASEVRKGDNILKLRDESGAPAWG